MKIRNFLSSFWYRVLVYVFIVPHIRICQFITSVFWYADSYGPLIHCVSILTYEVQRVLTDLCLDLCGIRVKERFM